LRRALVAAQVALSLTLVAGALLFSRSLGKLLTVEAGFRQEGVLVTSVGFRGLNLPPDRNLAFKGELLDRIKAIPGVESAADANKVPLDGNSSGNNVWMEGKGAEQKKGIRRGRVGVDYFKTLQIPLSAGREFDARDSSGATKVAVVNEAFARSLLNGANPVGQRFWIEKTPFEPETVYEIVGLVRNTKYEDLREEFGPIVYLASTQDPSQGPGGQFLIRSRLPQAEMIAAVKRVLNEVNPGINVRFQVFKTMIDASLLRERLMATLSGFFGLLALLLACVGLYGILSYGVASRTNEIGIRMALGAKRRDVLWLVMREAFLLVFIGVAAGLPLILAGARFASSLLFNLNTTDPLSLGGSALLMLVVAMVAGFAPARRATRVDPMVALRYE
jgi:predicted permease